MLTSMHITYSQIDTTYFKIYISLEGTKMPENIKHVKLYTESLDKHEFLYNYRTEFNVNKWYFYIDFDKKIPWYFTSKPEDNDSCLLYTFTRNGEEFHIQGNKKSVWKGKHWDNSYNISNIEFIHIHENVEHSVFTVDTNPAILFLILSYIYYEDDGELLFDFKPRSLTDYILWSFYVQNTGISVNKCLSKLGGIPDNFKDNTGNKNEFEEKIKKSVRNSIMHIENLVKIWNKFNLLYYDRRNRNRSSVRYDPELDYNTYTDTENKKILISNII